MHLALQLAAGAGVIIGSAVLAHFFYVASRTPEKMYLRLESTRHHTWGSLVYLGLVYISWTALVFSGAYGLLSLLGGGNASGIASLVAFFSIEFLAVVERSACRTIELQRELLVNKEIANLIRWPFTPSAQNIEDHKEKAQSSKSLVEREAHAELARLVANFAERDRTLCDLAVKQALRDSHMQRQEQQEKMAVNAIPIIAAKSKGQGKALRAAVECVQQQQKAEFVAQALAAKQVRYNQYKLVLEKNAQVITTIKILDDLEPDGEALLEPVVMQQKLKPFYDFVDKLRTFGTDAPIHLLLQSIEGAHLLKSATFTIELHGGIRWDGYYDIHSAVEGREGGLTDGLTFDPSIDGLIAAFFLRFVLPRELAWGHGLYGRNQEIVLSVEQAIDILEKDSISPKAPELCSLTMQPGFRIKRVAHELTLCCLTYYPGMGLFDVAVSINDGQASATLESKVFQWGQGILY